MTRIALFHMWKPLREQLIIDHNFYVDQAQKRLLSQFNDIESEADKFGENKLEEYAAYYNPEIDNSADLHEATYDEMCTHYQMLSDMRERTRLSVVAGMFHDWEKQLRNWITKELRHWQHYGIGENTNKAVWKASFNDVIELFEALGWSIKSQTYYISLDRCRLVVNVYKHGDGKAFDDIKNKYPEFVYCLDSTHMEFADYTNLKVDDAHIEEFSRAIIDFWKDAPEYIWDIETLNVPDWFAKAIRQDRQ